MVEPIDPSLPEPVFGKPESERYVHRERWFAAIFLLFACLVLSRFVYDNWLAGEFGGPSATVRLDQAESHPNPVAYAPDTYRLAIPFLFRTAIRLLHPQYVAPIEAAFDLVFGWCALFLLYRVAVDDLPVAGARFWRRALVLAFFFAFIQFPLAWVMPWERPETMPSTFFVATALFCVTKVGRSIFWIFFLVAATVFQSLVRADIPFAFGIALTALSLRKDILAAFGSRTSNLLKGLLVTALAGGTQAFLQFVAFPHLTYPPGTQVNQLKNNLLPHNLSTAGIALLPFAMLALFPIVWPKRLSAADALILAASAVYFVFWFSIGRLAEVRVYVPYMMALSVVAARVSAFLLTGIWSHSDANSIQAG